MAKAAARLGRLRRAAVLVQIFEISPSRDRVVAWVQDTMELWLGVAVSLVTALSRKEFLVVFTSEEDRDEVMAKPRGFLDGKVVCIVKWENPQTIKLTANMKLAWVELHDLLPFLEDQVETMLGVLCPIVHHSLEKQNELKYANGKGHWAKSCPKKRNGDARGEAGATETRVEVDVEPMKVVSGQPENDFTPVQSKSKNKVGDFSSRLREEHGVQGNRFAALEETEDAEMVVALEEDGEQRLKDDLDTGNASENNGGEKARVCRAPKKKAVERHKGGSLAWLDESINTEDDLGSDPCNIDEVQGERRVFGELNMNKNRPEAEDNGRLSLGSTGYKRQPLVDGLVQVGHHNTSRLSDHVPVSIVLQVEPEASHRHFESYFTMSYFELAVPAVKARAKTAWLNEAEQVHDSRRRWARGWQRVKQVLHEVRKDKDRIRREESGLAVEIAWRREMITADSSAEEVQALARMEGRLKAQELRDAREWKIRSREKWIGEDAAPARYFFTRLKAKWARESIVALEDQDGVLITDREEIFNEIHQFFQELYTAEDETSDRLQEREEA
ncbi:hypothetical protein R1sor_006118 [Riccia sorocarpa]|uniref:DUF4283 domain-containing protein n=1 Tax=Riccia sorocarpa TaxID=122646 RepID=A0ABD3HPF9_9MARC